MKTIIAAILSSVSFGAASATDTCKVFEYAELKDMPSEVLEKTASKYFSDSHEWRQMAIDAKTWEALSKYDDRSKVCRHEAIRITHAFSKKQQQEMPYTVRIKAWFCDLGKQPPEWLCGK